MKIKYVICSLLTLTLLAAGCANGGDVVDGTTSFQGGASSSATNTDETTAGTTVETTANTTAATTAAPKPVVLPTSNNLQFDADKPGIYNYCPAAMELEDGTVYIYYCTNQKSFNVTDYIGCRKGVRDSDGVLKWSEEKIVLSPGESGAWDAHHVCDPSIIAGSFSYGGENYGYLMAYLGCTSYDNQDNKIGLAVAKSPEGPFVKVGNEPFVNFTMDTNSDVFQWGVGQPSLVSVDKEGKVWIFYTRGDRYGTRLVVEQWNLSDLDSPKWMLKQELNHAGLTNLNGGADIMNNADLVYDPDALRFFSVSDCHPNPTDTPNYISSHFRVNYFAKTANFSGFTWKSVTQVGPEETGFARNHNAGVLRDAYGHLTDNGYLTVFYTKSDTGDSSLWTYRIYDYYVELPK